MQQQRTQRVQQQNRRPYSTCMWWLPASAASGHALSYASWYSHTCPPPSAILRAVRREGQAK
jgi:hypothetical protein